MAQPVSPLIASSKRLAGGLQAIRSWIPQIPGQATNQPQKASKRVKNLYIW